MKPAMAFLVIDGTDVRPVCLGCSEHLKEMGMLRVIGERPLPVQNVPPKTYSAILYALMPPYSIECCQLMVLDRHVGELWGSRL